jgi:hypothetical protein
MMTIWIPVIVGGSIGLTGGEYPDRGTHRRGPPPMFSRPTVLFAWSHLSEIIKSILGEMVGIALSDSCHFDDALSDLVARPVCREL